MPSRSLCAATIDRFAPAQKYRARQFLPQAVQMAMKFLQ
jgi:hypothetical protein